jgi:hypothetical protein
VKACAPGLASTAKSPAGGGGSLLLLQLELKNRGRSAMAIAAVALDRKDRALEFMSFLRKSLVIAGEFK